MKARVYRRITAGARRYRSSVEALIQVGAFVAAGVGAFLLRFDLFVPAYLAPHLKFALVVWVAAKVAAYFAFGVHKSWWGHLTTADVGRLMVANAAGSVVGGVVIGIWGPVGFPRSLYVLDFVLCVGLSAMIRLAAQLFLRLVKRRAASGPEKRVLVYGAGDAGLMLAQEVQKNPALPYKLVGFVDDDPLKRGRWVMGLEVYGGMRGLEKAIEATRASLVLIAIPSASGPVMQAILNACYDAGVAFKTMPRMGELIEGNGLLSQVRDVAVEDLLGRSPARLDVEEIGKKLRGQVVLVTGAAGSIGSEMCRQIAKFGPAKLVGYDAAETPLFFLEREMRLGGSGVRFAAEMGSIQNRVRLDEVFEAHGPAVVFHAAAYKHVPMMESAVFEAVENNVFGTLNLAECAAEHGVRDFVMISSDKAVHPTNMMGATKRLAELVVRGMQNGGTKFVSVRFGNVLGSNGSVIPIFKEQIAKGGPVTVTHPEMRRYFMTIPEAAQLVLQASTLGEGGEIFVLDMGEPVKIADLARNLILLSGLRPGEDIRIEYSGVRPGEKLYEELHLMDEDTRATRHEKILVFGGQSLEAAELERVLGELRAVCRTRDVGRLLLTIKSVVRDYNVSSELLERAIEKAQAGGVGGEVRAAEAG